MPIIHIREDAKAPKAGAKSKPAKKKKGAGKAEVPSDQKLDEKVTTNTTGDK